MFNSHAFSTRFRMHFAPAVISSFLVACSGSFHSASPDQNPSTDDAAGNGDAQDVPNPVLVPILVDTDAGLDGTVADSGVDADLDDAVKDAPAEAGDGAADVVVEAAPVVPPCLAPNLACDAGCLANDVNNCGGCGSACTAPAGATASCDSAGGTYACSWACGASYTTCGGGCLPTASLQSDPANCGACGHSCIDGACTQAACQSWLVAQGSLTSSREETIPSTSGPRWRRTARTSCS